MKFVLLPATGWSKNSEILSSSKPGSICTGLGRNGDPELTRVSKKFYPKLGLKWRSIHEFGLK